MENTTIESFNKKKRESSLSASYYKQKTNEIRLGTTTFQLLLVSISHSYKLARPLTSIRTWW